MKRECLNTIGMIIMALLMWGCAGPDSGMADRGQVETGRFLLYDQYTIDLGREETALKDAFLFSATTAEKIVAITFDDGPSKNSEKIIATLKKLDCPATFFLIAAGITPEKIKPYRDDHFETALHGYAHEHLATFDRQGCSADMSRSRAVFETFGMQPKYFRPPYGDINEDLKNTLQQHMLTGVLWSLDSLDWNHLSGEKLIDRVVSNVRNGDIILFHETAWTADALEKIVTGIRDRGFKIVTLDYLRTFPKSPSPG